MNTTIFETTVTLNGKEYPLNLAEALEINESDLQSEYVRHATLFAFYATAYEMAVRDEKQLDMELDRLKAHLDAEGRNSAVSAALPKFTEKMAENYVVGNIRYKEKSEELIAAQYKAGILKAARDALVHRRDMLLQLGSTQRQEHASDISLKQSMAKNVKG